MNGKNLFVKIVEHPVTPYIVLIFFALAMISPIVLIFFNSFKSSEETFAWPPTIIPNQFSLEAYARVINSPIPMNLRNSTILALSTTVIVLLIAVPSAYGISKYPFKGSKILMLGYLASRIVPPLSLLIPFYMLFSQLKLLNTLAALVIVDTYMSFPLVVWMLKGFFDEFPQELIDAALIDGCSQIGTMFRVVIPVSVTAIAAAGIITFLWTWNEFIYAIILTSSKEVFPMTVGIFYFVGDEVIEWNSLSAVAIFTSLPAIIFFILFQRYIIEGLVKGAIKM
ncbi:MAG: carbohydrate ABC transporter permease [Thaumarchaeota archaeon]|nr:carbohydrate ABC transporter permease [Nitrososphaerota archaeon]